MSREIVLTAVFGPDAERLDRTFASFARHTDAELHALIIGQHMPAKRVAGVHYHLASPDPSFGRGAESPSVDPAEREFELYFRNACYRRWELIDQLGADHCLVVDGIDVLCLQPLPPIRQLLRGATVGACVEHVGHYYLRGQGYTSNFLNAGVTFWDVAASRRLRADILALGRSELRCRGDDQWVFNEVVQTRYYDELIILPCQFNYRAYLGRAIPGWPSVSHLDGVRIYHNGDCIEAALALGPIRPQAELVSPLPIAEPPRRWLRLRRPWQWITHGLGRDGGPLVVK